VGVLEFGSEVALGVVFVTQDVSAGGLSTWCGHGQLFVTAVNSAILMQGKRIREKARLDPLACSSPVLRLQYQYRSIKRTITAPVRCTKKTAAFGVNCFNGILDALVN